MILPADSSSPRDRLIVALDFPSVAGALALVDQLEGRCPWFKVGLELYCIAGNSFVELLQRRGFKVFLDLKLHDIPNTVAGAIRSVASLGASLLTLHAAGGAAMMEAAAEAAAALPAAPRLLAVTVLTSISPDQLSGVGIPSSPSQQVLRLARLAQASCISGLVCSPQETAALRQQLPASLLVVPGIRLSGSAADDQSRTATPASAVLAGASMLVVGRPITQAPDPAAAVDTILAEMAHALSGTR